MTYTQELEKALDIARRITFGELSDQPTQEELDALKVVCEAAWRYLELSL